MFKSKPIDLTAHIGHAKNLVERIGIELEGAWSNPPADAAIVRDGSVIFDRAAQDYHRRAGEWPPDYKGPRHIGELASAPMPVTALSKWMQTYYPDMVNATCGMHLHMSFRDALPYQRLMVEAFPATMVEEIKKWGLEKVAAGVLEKDHSLFPRCNGDSEYCQHLFHADEQARQAAKGYDHHARGHRYTVMNYAFVRTATIECRLLPMMPSVGLAIEALTRVIDVTNAFVFANKGREPVELVEVEEPKGGGRELEEEWI